ncbi:MAG: Na-K-Cl cotransporter [Candidatus Omnitrophica bacterium]|nr:Na-K-Cl cotransporter [Candidatus Omnitrophota bacterium]
MLWRSKLADKDRKVSGYQFGTFLGVFTPNILTILGVVMYLRFGWVVGNVGIFETLLIVTISTFITLMTSFSISQLATNAKVGTGGAYYIISRSLGIHTGAAIGLPLFFGQALSVAFYVTGFSESLHRLMPQHSIQFISLVTLLIIVILAFISAGFALKIQLLIMTMIALSLISFFMGDASLVSTLPAPAFQPASFWIVFAIFFPAVTGILSGLSMSGDLKDPARSIPKGTIGAVMVSYVIYMMIPLFFWKLRIPSEVLVANPMIMQSIAKWHPLILAGLWGATLSSAIGAMLGAPRTLQALARDSIVFKTLGRGFGKNKEPHLALLIAFLLSLSGILLNSLDKIASVLTMFFLTTYGLLNFSAAIEGLIRNPSWRPSFRAHWGFSFVGAVSCFAVMLMISPGATMIAILISIGIYLMMHQRNITSQWGDMKYAILMLLTRFALYRLVKEKVHEKAWRPNILVLSGSPASRWHLIAIADAISQGKGFLTIAALLKEEHTNTDRIESIRKSIESYLSERKVPAIVRVQPTGEDILKGASKLISHYGFGPLVPNTIMAGISDKKENGKSFAQMIRTAVDQRKNVILVHEAEDIHELKSLQIDMWWRRGGENAGLMLTIAYLLMTSPEWAGAKLVLKTILGEKEDEHQEMTHLTEFLKTANIEAEVQILPYDSRSPVQRIQHSSKDSDLVFLGLRQPQPEETLEAYTEYYTTFISQLHGFPATALVLANEKIDFQKIFELRTTAS